MRTPEQWLPVLAKRLDNDSPRVKLLRSYQDGNAPLPEGRENVRESWKRFQRDARTNWGQLILEAVTDRIVPKGITVGGDSQSEIAVQANRIWRDNRMDSVFQTWLRDGMAFRRSFLTCWTGDDRRAVITADSPESMYAATDPLQPWRVRAALRVWRDPDEGMDFGLVWSENAWQRFFRPSMFTNEDGSTVLTTMVQGKWYPDGDPIETGQEPPVVVYNNPGGVGEYEPHLDLINRINKSALEILSIVAMLAFRQRALKRVKEGEPLPQTDESGNAIDWAKRLEYAPGALWDLPPGIDVWESQSTDIGPLLAGMKDHVRQLSAVTRTPLPMLMPDNANTSAAGAIAAEAGYITRCGTRLTESRIGAEAILLKALRVEGADVGEESVSVEFENVEMVSLAEKYQAASQAVGVQSRKSIQRQILGWGPEEIRQDEVDAAGEALRALLTQPRVNDRPDDNPQ